MNKNFAFTLAEALIVLTIVAVLASLSVIATSKAKPDEHIIMFRRAYSTTLKVVQNLINDTTLYPNADKPVTTSPLGSVGSNKNGFKGNTDSDTNNFAVNFKNSLNPISYNDGSSGTYHSAFVTSDGIYWNISDFMHSDGYAMITVYLSGNSNKGCVYNSSSCPMPTKFIFKVSNLGQVTPVLSTASNAGPDLMAITYIRYNKANKQSQIAKVYDGK